MKNKNFFLCAFIVIVVFYSCKKDDETTLWENSCKSNTIESFQNYLIKYPNGKFKNQADSTIQLLVWENVKTQNTPESFEKYLSEYPMGFNLNEANKMYEDVLWVYANKHSNMEYYVKYNIKFPDGKYILSVKKHIEKYMIENERVGYFKIGMFVPKSRHKDFDIKVITESIENVVDDYYYEISRTYVVDKNEKMLELIVNDSNEILSIIILSDKFKTDKNISINSKINDFITTYPDNFVKGEIIGLANGGEREYFYFVVKGEKGVEFEIDSSNASTVIDTKLENVTEKSKILGIRVFREYIDKYEQALNEHKQNIARKEKEKQEEIQRKNSTNSTKSNKLGKLPSWLSGTTWRLKDSNGDFLLGVRFISNDYLIFEMYGFKPEKCEYGIPSNPNSNINLIAFKYLGQYIELYYNNSDQKLMTSEGYYLRKGY